MTLVAQVVLVLAAMLLCALGLVRVLDARTQERLAAHQTQDADLWARMLTARMETHQRLLTAIAEGMHTSLLDNPAVLDALMQQDGSMLRIFDSLHVALPAGGLTHHGAVGAVTEIDSQGLDGLRRTISEGKPFITHVPVLDDSQHLRVMLSVPMRREDGQVSGALAAIVKLPLAALMPDTAAPLPNVQYMLIGSDGLVLAHSDALQRGKNLSDLALGHEKAWLALSNPSAANADTQQWGHFLVSRVGLPLPQWQVVIWRDTSADLLVDQGLPVRVWAALGAAAALLSLLATALLWGWLAPWPGRGGGAACGPWSRGCRARSAKNASCAGLCPAPVFASRCHGHV
ncbi:cache domain-containing protein [Comamonas aquatica]|nr:cache domain-containing protein [Comamonas aquatica]